MYILFTVIAAIAISLLFILEKFNIRYKGKCIKHDWEYKFEYGDYWRYTGTFLKYNRRWECKNVIKLKRNEK